MKRIAPVVAIIFSMVFVAISVPAPVGAITGGAPDGDAHPYVALIFDANSLCTGTLIAPTVVLTAGHCTTAFEKDSSPVYVTFDPAPTANSTLYQGNPHTDPKYVPVELPAEASAASHDVGIIVLDRPADMPQYGVLPTPDAAGKLIPDDSELTAVGYGVQSFTGNGRPEDAVFGSRANADLTLAAAPDSVAAGVLAVSPGTGPNRGDVCYGDSGGPLFVGDTKTVIAVVSGGTDQHCQGPSLAARIDTPDVLSFIASYTGNTTTAETTGKNQAAFGPGATVVVTDNGLRLRAAPSTSAEVVASLAQGTVLQITGPSVQADGYTWWPVENPSDPSQSGYVAAPYITAQS